MEGLFGNALELGEPDFCPSPKAFDAVDMGWAIDELVLRVIDAESDHSLYRPVRYSRANHRS